LLKGAGEDAAEGGSSQKRPGKKPKAGAAKGSAFTPEASPNKAARGKKIKQIDAGEVVNAGPRKKPKFAVDDRVLGASYIGHGELYEARVLNVRTDVKHGVPVWQYMLHYQGWASKWDEWVSEDGVHVINDESRRRQAEIKEENRAKRELERKQRLSRKKAKPTADPESNIDKEDFEPKEKAYKVREDVPLLERAIPALFRARPLCPDPPPA